MVPVISGLHMCARRNFHLRVSWMQVRKLQKLVSMATTIVNTYLLLALTMVFMMFTMHKRLYFKESEGRLMMIDDGLQPLGCPG